jgi:hypothetical protein
VETAARAERRNIRKNNGLCEFVIKDKFYNELGWLVLFGTTNPSPFAVNASPEHPQTAARTGAALLGSVRNIVDVLNHTLSL